MMIDSIKNIIDRTFSKKSKTVRIPPVSKNKAYNGISTFDFDGVVFMGYDPDGTTPIRGMCPFPEDIIVSARLARHYSKTREEARALGVPDSVKIYLNYDEDVFEELKTFHPGDYPFNHTRVGGGLSKIHNLKNLMEADFMITKHYDDDPLHVDMIRHSFPNLPVVWVNQEPKIYPKELYNLPLV